MTQEDSPEDTGGSPGDEDEDEPAVEQPAKATANAKARTNRGKAKVSLNLGVCTTLDNVNAPEERKTGNDARFQS